MVGEQIAQFSFGRAPGPDSRCMLVSLGLVGEDLVLTDIVPEGALPVVTAHMVEVMSTFGTHTESCEVLNGEEK